MIDSIQLWSDVALEARRARRAGGDGARLGPTRTLQVLAIAHQAMYDAYVVVAQPAEFAPSLPGLPAAPAGASASAAIAAAAHAILTALCPDQRALLDAKLAAAAAPDDPGLQLGREIAAAILEEHDIDPGLAGGGGASSPARGRRRAGSGSGPGTASLHGARIDPDAMPRSARSRLIEALAATRLPRGPYPRARVSALAAL